MYSVVHHPRWSGEDPCRKSPSFIGWPSRKINKGVMMGMGFLRKPIHTGPPFINAPSRSLDREGLFNSLVLQSISHQPLVV